MKSVDLKNGGSCKFFKGCRIGKLLPNILYVLGP